MPHRTCGHKPLARISGRRPKRTQRIGTANACACAAAPHFIGDVLGCISRFRFGTSHVVYRPRRQLGASKRAKTMWTPFASLVARAFPYEQRLCGVLERRWVSSVPPLVRSPPLGPPRGLVHPRPAPPLAPPPPCTRSHGTALPPCKVRERRPPRERIQDDLQDALEVERQVLVDARQQMQHHFQAGAAMQESLEGAASRVSALVLLRLRWRE